MFGPETRGLPDRLLAENRANTYRIPMKSPHVRSLNLANAVSIIVYEALRQTGNLEPRARGPSRRGPAGIDVQREDD